MLNCFKCLIILSVASVQGFFIGLSFLFQLVQGWNYFKGSIVYEFFQVLPRFKVFNWFKFFISIISRVELLQGFNSSMVQLVKGFN